MHSTCSGARWSNVLAANTRLGAAVMSIEVAYFIGDTVIMFMTDMEGIAIFTIHHVLCLVMLVPWYEACTCVCMCDAMQCVPGTGAGHDGPLPRRGSVCARAALLASLCTGEITNPLSNLCDILDHTASFASSPALVYLRHVRVQLLAPLFFWSFCAMRGLFGMPVSSH
jgi:hypothetical protein